MDEFDWDKITSETTNTAYSLEKHIIDKNSSVLSVFWWNVQYGYMNNRLHEKYGLRSLDFNLKKLINSALVPDVLVLGEFKYPSLTKDTLKQLRSVYTYEYFTPYEKGEDTGFVIFSRYTPKEYVNVPLDWSPLFKQSCPFSRICPIKLTTSSDQKKYRKKIRAAFPKVSRYFERKYLRFTLRVKGRDFHLFPIHFLNPWGMMQKEKLAFKPLQAIEFWLGKENPLYYQVQRFNNLFNYDLGKNTDDLFLMIGDFNVAYGESVTPSSYPLVKQNHSNIFSTKQYTFPSASAVRLTHQKAPNVQIDYGFVNNKNNVVKSAVLPLSGSDHYPIYTLIDTSY